MTETIDIHPSERQVQTGSIEGYSDFRIKWLSGPRFDANTPINSNDIVFDLVVPDGRKAEEFSECSVTVTRVDNENLTSTLVLCDIQYSANIDCQFDVKMKQGTTDWDSVTKFELDVRIPSK